MKRHEYFRIEWAIPEDEWRTAGEVFQAQPPHGDFDRLGLALSRLLFGRVQYIVGSGLLFPPDRLLERAERIRATHLGLGDAQYDLPAASQFTGAYCSVLDIMWKLDWLFYNDRRRFQFPSTPARYCEEDSTRCVSFSQTTAVVTINSSLFKDISLSCPEHEFKAGVESSLRTFADELFRRFPSLTHWQTFEGLAWHRH